MQIHNIHRLWPSSIAPNRRWSWRERLALGILAAAAVPAALLLLLIVVSIGAVAGIVLMATLGAAAVLNRRRRPVHGGVIGAEYVHLDEPARSGADVDPRQVRNPWVPD